MYNGRIRPEGVWLFAADIVEESLNLSSYSNKALPASRLMNHHSVNDSESELSTILLNCTSNLEDGEVAQWPYWIEDIGVTNASSEQDILHLPTCPKRRSVGEYGLLEIQKRACSSSRVSFSGSGISDVLPPAAPTARPSPNINTSPPPGIQIPADYLSKH